MQPNTPELEQMLNANCDRIEVVLAIARITATVAGAQVTTHTIRYTITPALGTKVSRIPALHSEFAAALDVPRCRVSQAGQAFLLEAPRPNPPDLQFEPLWKSLLDQDNSIPPFTALLGQADDGIPLLARLTAPDVTHALASGTTGSGKTELLRVIGLSLALANPAASLRLVIVDPANRKLAQLGQFRHCLWGPLTRAPDVAAALNRLLDQLDRPNPTPRIVVLIDELADLVMQVPTAIATITRLTQRGREAGIHVIAATQKPTASILGSLIKANFPARICGKVTSGDDARVATGQAGTGAEKLPGRGSFVLAHGGIIHRFQAPLIQDLERILTNLPHARPTATLRPGPHPLEVVWPISQPEPDPPVDDDTRLARKLLAWELWPGRRTDDGSDYRWGWISAASRYLFDRDAAGTWHRRTVRAIAAAEDIETNHYRAGQDVANRTAGGYANATLPCPTRCRFTGDPT